jgi:general secretion pathway protein G
MQDINMKQKKSKGFTLIEIMIVIAIIGMLAGLILPKIQGRSEEAKKVIVKQEIASIMNALKFYKLDNGVYPSQDQGLSALVNKPSIGQIPSNWKKDGYLDKMPKDPWGEVYKYNIPGIHSEIDIFSFGSDKFAGGEGEAADIGNWE